MFGSKGLHQAYVNTEGRGYGRYVYTVTCRCGRQYGPYSDKARAEKSAQHHERTGR
ncbi:hypothetical protein AB0H30_26980 [Streptomyces pseudogriseolus]|uniref:hypothetical protein n=1 Tax=Streptomyces pseudogriseolus TaxID=36817 RepID=UPI00346A86F6